MFIQADVFFILGIEITGKLLNIQPAEHRGYQPACNPLLLVYRIHTNEEQIVIDRKSVV
jgi:hypothetical protein